MVKSAIFVRIGSAKTENLCFAKDCLHLIYRETPSHNFDQIESNIPIVVAVVAVLLHKKNLMDGCQKSGKARVHPG